MGKDTKIEWASHTFNFVIGCTKVSEGCVNCYAEALMDHRMKKVKWGPGQERVRTSEGNWRKPIKWDREAAEAGRRDRVFCASLADWLDHEIKIEDLADLLELISRTPNLDWLLLTKRPQNFWDRLEQVVSYTDCNRDCEFCGRCVAMEWLDCEPPPNVWVGATVENQRRADERIPELLKIPARVRFLSCEPLLGAIDMHGGAGINWVICGGESGRGARPMNPSWARELRDDCVRAGVPFLFKQWGAWAPTEKGALPVVGQDKFTFNAGEPGQQDMVRVGKKAAGRTLDWIEWNEVPSPAAT